MKNYLLLPYVCSVINHVVFQQQLFWDKTLTVAASVLAKLNKLNSNLNGNQVKKGTLKVPHSSFYIPQLADKIDIRYDYMRWIHADNIGIKVSICFVVIYWYEILVAFIKIKLFLESRFLFL